MYKYIKIILVILIYIMIYIYLYIYTFLYTHTHMHVVYSLIDRADVRIRSTGAFCPGSRESARIGEHQKVVNPWEVPPPAQHLGQPGEADIQLRPW